MATLIDELREHLADEFDDFEPIGEGGYGKVWRCSRRSSGASVALKALRLDCDDPTAPDRFSREVRLLKSLDHPNIVRVYDAHLSEPPLYFTMPWYAESLEDQFDGIVGDEGRIILIFERVLDGVEYLHSQGVIHRDLKPNNILMNSETDVVVSDFGLGRDLRSLTTRQTVTGQGFGTFGYMAPEQAESAKDVDARADIFSLGKVLYELLTGERNPLAQPVFDNVPPRYRRLVRKCVEPGPNNRYDSIAALKQDWRVATDPDSVRLRRVNIATMLDFSDGIDMNLAAALARIADQDLDLLHELVMEIPELALQGLWEFEKSSMHPVIREFVDFVANKDWGYDYTDKLGNRLSFLHRLVDDEYELLAQIVWSTAKLGLAHNRWHVMGLVGEMLRDATDGVQQQLIWEALQRLSVRRLSSVQHL